VRPAGDDPIALVKQDHATVKDLFRRYEALGPGALRSRERIAERVIKELSVHAAMEEQVLYPNVRSAVPGGDAMVEHGLDEHQKAKKLLLKLDRTDTSDAKFDTTMRKVIDDVRDHIKEEEAPGGMLAGLRQAASRDQLADLAKLMRSAKKAAPTRPHPRAPKTPPGNIMLGTATAFVDKARDAGRRVLRRRQARTRG
jgi:Hemerythrin HHE cation binding domain